MPKCELPSCSRFDMPMIRRSTRDHYYCGGQTSSGNYYAVLDDLIKKISTDSNNKEYEDLLSSLRRAVTQVEMIIEDQQKEE